METREQRRVRIIDEYVLKNFHPYATCGNLPWLINIAKKVADATIAETSQPETDTPSRLMLAEKFIDELMELCTRAAGIMGYWEDLGRRSEAWERFKRDLCRLHERFELEYIRGEK